MNLITDPIRSLDHAYVRLVSFMQPAMRPDGWTGDHEIARNARASFDMDWKTGQDIVKDAKLIHRLYRDHHTSPFEAMSFTFEVQVPIFVLRQWMRHRTWAYNEVSARYTELPDVFYIPSLERLQKQSKDNKQGSAYEVIDHPEIAQAFIRQSSTHTYALYQQLLSQELTRELARIVLPLNIYSRMFCTVNLHNLFHFLALRLHNHAQYEIRQPAEGLLRLITPIVPASVQAFHRFKRELREVPGYELQD